MQSAKLVLPGKPRAFSALIDGKLIAAADRERIVRENPAHLAPVSEYPKATKEDAAAAVRAARKAADQRVWASLSGLTVHAC